MVTYSDKHPSLLCYRFNYDYKKFCNCVCMYVCNYGPYPKTRLGREVNDHTNACSRNWSDEEEEKKFYKI
jgi:hypothetical protein